VRGIGFQTVRTHARQNLAQHAVNFRFQLLVKRGSVHFSRQFLEKLTDRSIIKVAP
jgi:hypothetical protein